MLESLHLELLLKSFLLGTHLLVDHRLDILPLIVKLFLQFDDLGVLVPYSVHVAEHEERVANASYFDSCEDFGDFAAIHDGLVPSHLIKLSRQVNILIRLLLQAIFAILQVFFDFVALFGQFSILFDLDL